MEGPSTTKLYEELVLESLSHRRCLRRLCQFYKIQNELAPSYLKEPIPQPRKFRYCQHQINVLHEIPCRTTRFLNSFYPDTIRLWKNIDLNPGTVSKFKSKNQYLPYMTLVVLKFYFNLGLAIQIHRKYATVVVISLLNVLYLQLPGLIYRDLFQILIHNNSEHFFMVTPITVRLCKNCLVLQASKSSTSMIQSILQDPN